jgi:diguanylate cyclase (GGDEF)-like protein
MSILFEQAGARLQHSVARIDDLCLRLSASAALPHMRCRILAGFLLAQMILITLGVLVAPAPLALSLTLVLAWQGAVAWLLAQGVAARLCAHLAVLGLAGCCAAGAWSIGAKIPLELPFALPLCAFCLIGQRAGYSWLAVTLLAAPLLSALSVDTVAPAVWQRWHTLPGAIVWMSALIALGLYDFCNGLLNQRLQKSCEENAARITTDAVTGLANRAALHQRLREAMEHARRNGTLVGVVTVRLDNWPQLLASGGGKNADAILRESAQRIQNSLRQTDLAGRAEPAEFELVLCNLKSRRGMEVVIRRLQLAFNEPIALAGGQCTVRATVGAAVFPYDAELSDDLFDIARAEGETLRFRSPRALVQVLG